MSGVARRRQRRTSGLLAAAVAVGLLGPLAVVFAQFWQDGHDELAAVEQERRGVAYLRPLTALLGHLAEAESTAVRQADVNVTELRAAIAAVDTADRAHGRALGTSERWRSLRQRVLSLAERGPVPPTAALTDYAETAELGVDLVVKVGDTSGLVLEPERDTYYLMDAVVRRLPHVVSGAAYLADLGRVAGRDDEARLLAARDRVMAASEAVEADLRRSLEATGRETLAVALLGPADAFVASAGAISSAALLSGDEATPDDADELARLSRSLQSTAVQLQAAALAELDIALANRHDQTSDTRQWVTVVVLAGLLLAATAGWFRLPRREPALEPMADDENARRAAADAIGRHADRTDATQHPPETPELIDARELLESTELVRVGRAVRSTRRPPTEDDEAGR